MEDGQTTKVDAGDLSEAMQAANAWAAYLRERAAERREKSDAPIDAQKVTDDINAADRIDSAVARLRSA